MFKSLFSLVILVSVCQAQAGRPVERKMFIGQGSSEAVMRFQGSVDVDAGAATAPGWTQLQIDKQVRFLFGWMTEGPAPAAPRGDHKITGIRVTRTDARTIKIDYSYEGTVVVKLNLGNTYDVALPRNPDTVGSFIPANGACSDPDFPAPEDLWESFNPRKRGCPLKAGVHYSIYKATLQRIANTKLTFPEYERLADPSGQILMSFMVGMDDGDHLRDPNVSRDLNANNFRAIKRTLLATGWTSRLSTPQEINAVILRPLGRGADRPYVEIFTKDVRQAGSGRAFHLELRMFYGPTGIEEASTPFHWYLKDSMEKSAVMIYDGHSGIGAYLDLPALERKYAFRFMPPIDRYQIYFFNSCSSYVHYNTMMFGRKVTARDPRGTKNLDIITTGLGTYFTVSHDTNMALINSIDLWAQGRARVSYQQLIRDIDSKNLAGINGDEDNPTR